MYKKQKITNAQRSQNQNLQKNKQTALLKFEKIDEKINKRNLFEILFQQELKTSTEKIIQLH